MNKLTDSNSINTGAASGRLMARSSLEDDKKNGAIVTPENHIQHQRSKLVEKDMNANSSSSFSLREQRRMSTEIKPMSPTNYLKNKNIQGLTINKLHFDRIGLVGRETESQTLHSCFARLMAPGKDDRRKELVFIKGYSGIGKSKLASTLTKEISSTENGLLVRGKFDLNDRDEPYSGFSAAFGEICRSLTNFLDSKEETKEENMLAAIRDSISSEIGSEVNLLVKLIPELEAIIPACLQQDTVAESHDFQAGQERLKYSFQALMRVLNYHFAPMVVVLDDLHWGDVPSLELLDHLISDTQNLSSLMIVGCFRSNEVDDTHILSNKIKDLSAKKQKAFFNMTDIELGNLHVNDINKFVMSILSIDDEEQTQALAKICSKRTLGNPFFLIEFITMLEAERLLTFNLGLLSWTWDEQLIDDATMSTANVVEVLQARMRKLPQHTQLILEYAACLGSTFTLPKLDLIWTKHAMERATPDDLISILQVLKGGNFIESYGTDTYRWVHDKVQEAALLLGDALEASFQFQIGSILYHSLNEEELEESLFDIVNLINKENVKRRRLEFAELNLRAAEKARAISAFHSAAIYVSKGIEHLPNDKWDSQRDLTLRLYTLGAEMELAAGRAEVMEEYSTEVLLARECSTIDKVPLYLTKLYKLSNVEIRHKEAVQYCLFVLKELGCNVIPNCTILPIHALMSLYRTVRVAKNNINDFVKKPKMMIDPEKKASMFFLFRLFYASYFLKNDFLLILSVTNMVQLTLGHGVSQMSGPGFASLALLTGAVLQDFEAAASFAQAALLVKKLVPGAMYTETTTVYMVHIQVLPWTRPMQSCFVPISEAYTCGMQSGNTEMAMWALLMKHIYLPYQMGKPLGRILTLCSSCSSKMEIFQQQHQKAFLHLFWQVILNLSGQSKETTTLDGEVFNREDFPILDVMIHAARLELLLIFGDFKQAAELAVATGDGLGEAFPGWFFFMLVTFHRGVALYAMARKTKKWKYKRPANKIRKTIKRWVAKGNPNVKHYYTLLAAEQAALDKKYKAAKQYYEDSILLAARTGHLQDAALFNERYADFLICERADVEEANYRLSEALRYYKLWGAGAKVEILTESML